MYSDGDNEAASDLEMFEAGAINSFMDRPQSSDKPVRYMLLFALALIVLSLIYRYIPGTIGFQLLFGLASFAGWVVLLILLVRAFIKVSERYVFTETHLKIQRGRLLRKTLDIPWALIESVSSTVSIMQRHFGTGDLTLHLPPAFTRGNSQ